eukprot:3154016-Prymnesium_polylepis.1
MFSVFRPTSYDAISKMWLGNGVGKGLNVKGKSAKKGHLSGYVPFLQISEADHTQMVSVGPSFARTRIFFRSEEERDRVCEWLERIMAEMQEALDAANETLLGTSQATAGWDEPSRISGRSAEGLTPEQGAAATTATATAITATGGAARAAAATAGAATAGAVRATAATAAVATAAAATAGAATVATAGVARAAAAGAATAA